MCQIIIILIAMSLWQACDTAHDLTVLQVETIRQMRDEWKQQPFTEINVRNNCHSGEETLFGVPWGGSERGCYNYGGLLSQPWVETVEDFNSNKRMQNSLSGTDNKSGFFRDEECSYIWGKDPISQDKFLGKRLCGKRGGPTYTELKRANEKNECPEDLKLCSNNTSFEDSICTNDTEKCPVNEIKFVKDKSRRLQMDPQAATEKEEAQKEPEPQEVTEKDEAQNETESIAVVQDGQRIQNMTKGWKLVTSTQGKGRPVMQFFAGDHACIDHNIYQRPKLDTYRYYPLENDRHGEVCPIQRNTKWQYDDRYKDVGFSIDEWHLQSDNYVTRTLHSLPLYDKYVPNERSLKQEIEYQFSVREMIPWKLECEKENTRRKIVSQIDQVDHHSNPVI